MRSQGQRIKKLRPAVSVGAKPNAGGDLSVMRSMPESLAAEAAVLGSMLIDPECIGDVVEHLTAEAFYRVEHRYIYDALITLYEKNQGVGIDAVLLREELIKRNQLEEVGVEYIVKILDSVPSSANVGYYAGIVKDKMLLRELISTAGEILDSAYSQTGETAEVLDEAEQKMFSITDKNISGSATALKDLVARSFELIEKRQGIHVTGLPTGFYELDELTCGLQDGEMIIVAGRPSMGKTSLALNIAEHIGLMEKIPVAIFSLEMGQQQLAEKFLCSISGIESQKVRRGSLNDEAFKKLADACAELSETPIYIDDSSTLTPLELRAKARRLKSRHDIRCILVDYLQLMHLGSGRVESRQMEITTISRYLKALARELNIPVIILSQLNRSPESRESTQHRPRMSDLRESGSIEQDADVIMMLHREDYYNKDKEGYEPNNTAELIIVKQRNGPTGTIKMRFLEKTTRFVNASHVEHPAGEGVPF
ncbi:MAG: replicative DNA helicase [Planctomycetes bacterium]|nr:replicative DNA helicase [Planctomycetota bacterium]MBL7144416.1 replicative DNA helicase [Phycisphaerae bacterium]